MYPLEIPIGVSRSWQRGGRSCGLVRMGTPTLIIRTSAASAQRRSCRPWRYARVATSILSTRISARSAESRSLRRSHRSPSPEAPRWYRKKWVIAVASIVTLAVIAGGVVAAVVVTTGKEQASSSAPTTSAAMAIKNWWSGAQQDFADLQKAIADAKAAENRRDGRDCRAC